MITFNKPIKNDGSEDFRQCMMDYCLKPKEMPIHISKEDVESLMRDKSLTVIFEKGSSLREMTSEIALCKSESSKCVLQMVYLKYHSSYKLLMEDIKGGNELLQLFDNTHNPIWGLAADETIETKMEMMLAYSVEPVKSDTTAKV